MRRWVLPSTVSFDLLRIVFLSAAVGLFYLQFGSVSVLPGFSNYTAWADGLFQGADLRGQTWLPFRDIGMPLLLLATFYPITHSLTVIVALQTAMGIAMPALVYSTLRPWFPKAAFVAGLLSIATLAPYLYSKTLHHDQPFDFFMLVSVWLVSRYAADRRASNLYVLSLAMAELALLRLFAIALYPFLLACCLACGGKRPYRHFIGGALIFAGCMTAYSEYRHHALGNPPSSLGQQIFFNAYLDSAEYGAKFSPDDGPNMRILLAAALAGLQPSPAKAPVLASTGAPSAFVEENFYKYSAVDLLDHMLSAPNTEYFYFFNYVAPNDEVLVGASLEAIRAHPLYFVRYSWRNVWEFLYDPGFVFPRFVALNRIRGGLLFPLTGATTAGQGTVGDVLPEPALAEAEYRPLARAPGFIRRSYLRIERLWYELYHPVTKITFGLMLAAWISLAVGLLEKVVGRLQGAANLLLSRRVLPATAAVSLMLLLNIGITGILVGSYYRYHDSIVLLKLMLAVVGATIVGRVAGHIFRCLRRGQTSPPRGELDAGLSSLAQSPLSHRTTRLAWLGLGCLLGVGLIEWGASAEAIALAAPAPGRVNVVESGYGENCGAPKNFSLQWVRSACNGKRDCTFVFDGYAIGNPALKCVKEFYIAWKCAPDGELHRVFDLFNPVQNLPIPIGCAD